MSLFTLYWGVMLIFAPLFIRIYVPGEGWFRLDGDFSKNTFFLWAAFLSMTLFGTGKLERFYRFLYVVPAFLVIHTFWIQWNPYENKLMQKWLIISVASCLFVQFVTNARVAQKRYIINFIAVSAIIQSVYIILQWFGVQPMGLFLWHVYDLKYMLENVNNGVTGVTLQQTLSGGLLAASLPVFFRKKWFSISPVVIWASYLTLSAMTFAACLAGFLTWLVFKYSKKPLLWMMSGGALTTVALTVLTAWPKLVKDTFFDDQERFFIWSRTLDYQTGLSNILGFGVGNYYANFRKFQPMDPHWGHPHNEYLWLYSSFGLVGCALFAWVILRLSYLPKKDPILMAGLVSIAVNAIGTFSLHVASIGMLFIIYLAFFINDNRRIQSWPFQQQGSAVRFSAVLQ